MADVRAVLALKSEFPKLDLVLVGATEGWLVAQDIAAAGVPVIANGLNDLPEMFEQLGATQSNAGRLARAGVKVAINADGLQNPRRLQQVAGNLVALTKLPGAAGMSWGQAFAAISSVPADISGMGGKAGVLKPGALGDVVIWSDDPLEVGSVPTRVFIAGREQDLTNHQTRLRDRYKDLDESDRPKAYDW
jgi:imidazolonepropionase-like amidohydrolase